MLILHKQVKIALLLFGFVLLSGDNMSTIEFEVQAKNGIIKIPDKYTELENAFLRIKVQPYKIASCDIRKLKIKQLLELIRRKNIFRNIAIPEEWQRNLRDEWEKGIA